MDGISNVPAGIVPFSPPKLLQGPVELMLIYWILD